MRVLARALILKGGNSGGATAAVAGGTVAEIALSGAAITNTNRKKAVIWCTEDLRCIQTKHKATPILEDNEGNTEYCVVPKNTMIQLEVQVGFDYLQYTTNTASTGTLYVWYIG